MKLFIYKFVLTFKKIRNLKSVNYVLDDFTILKAISMTRPNGRPSGSNISMNEISSFALLFLLSNAIRNLLKEGNKQKHKWNGGLQLGNVHEFLEEHGIKIPKTSIPHIYSINNIFWSKDDYNISLNQNSFEDLLLFIRSTTPYIFVEPEKDLDTSKSNDFERTALEYLMIEIFSKHMDCKPDKNSREGLFKIFTALKNICTKDSGMTAFFLHYLSTRIKNDIDMFTHRDEKSHVLKLPVGHNDFNNVFKHLFDYFKCFVMGTSVPEFNNLIWTNNDSSIGREVLERNKRFVEDGGEFIRLFIGEWKKNSVPNDDLGLSKKKKEIFRNQLEHGITVYFIQPLQKINTSDYDFTIFFNPEVCVNKMNFETDVSGNTKIIESEIHFGDRQFLDATLHQLRRLVIEQSRLYSIHFSEDKKDIVSKKVENLALFFWELDSKIQNKSNL